MMRARFWLVCGVVCLALGGAPETWGQEAPRSRGLTVEDAESNRMKASPPTLSRAETYDMWRKALLGEEAIPSEGESVSFPPGVLPSGGREGVILLREICGDASSRRCVRILAPSAENVDIATLLQPNMGRPCSGQELLGDLRCVSPSTPPSGEAMAGVLAPYELGSQPYFVKEGMACRIQDMFGFPECERRFPRREAYEIIDMVEHPDRLYLRAGYTTAPAIFSAFDRSPAVLSPSSPPAVRASPASPPPPASLASPPRVAPPEPRGPGLLIAPSVQPERPEESPILEFPEEPETIHR